MFTSTQDSSWELGDSSGLLKSMIHWIPVRQGTGCRPIAHRQGKRRRSLVWQATATPQWQKPLQRYDGNHMWVLGPFIVGWRFPKESARDVLSLFFLSGTIDNSWRLFPSCPLGHVYLGI